MILLDAADADRAGVLVVTGFVDGRVLPPECPDDITAFPLFRAGPWS